MHNINLIQDEFLSKNAIIENDKTYTYNDLKRKAQEYEKRIERNTLVLCFFNAYFESIALYVASLRGGFKCILTSPNTSKETKKEILNRYTPDYIATEGIKGNIEIEEYGKDQIRITDSIALLMPTSGSTGSPKMVIQTYKNIFSNMKSILEYLPITKNDRMITNLPMFYTYGLSCINTHLYAGAEIIIENRSITTRGFWETYEKYQPSSFAGVPYTYEVIKKLGFNLLFTEELKYITQAGGKMHNELINLIVGEAKLKGTKIYIMYGQTEATARMTYLPPELVTEKIGSIGKAIPGGRIHINSEYRYNYEGKECGELEYIGSNVTPGYAKARKDLISEKKENNVLETGDIGFKDKEGYYYIVARKNRIAKINGERIDLDYISNIVKKEVECNCAVVTNDKKLGVFIENIEGGTDKLKRMLKDKYGMKSRDIFIKQIEALPRTQSGKINYKKLVIE